MTTIRLLVISGAVALAGCASSDDAADHPVLGVQEDGSPNWVQRGSGAFDTDGQKAFFGVGIVQGVRNVALARRTADNRARGEIAAIFDLYVARLMKDYQRSTTADDFNATTEEQDVTDTQKTMTEVTLRGVHIREHWTDPNSQALYALAVLELDGMVESLDQAKNLTSHIREHVRANSARAFEELNQELEKKAKE